MKCPICLDATYLDREGKPAFWALDCYSDPKDVVKCPKCNQESAMTDLPPVEEHERIFLEPPCCADAEVGQQWCQDDVWSYNCEHGKKPTEYLRADIVASQLAAKDARVIELEARVKELEAEKSERYELIRAQVIDNPRQGYVLERKR